MASDKVKVFTDTDFDSTVQEAATPVLVDFWAEWCGPCRTLGPVIEKIAAANAGRIVVGKMNVDENPDVPMRFGIRGIPTLLLFKNGELVDSFVGADDSGIRKMVEKNVQ